MKYLGAGLISKRNPVWNRQQSRPKFGSPTLVLKHGGGFFLNLNLNLIINMLEVMIRYTFMLEALLWRIGVHIYLVIILLEGMSQTLILKASLAEYIWKIICTESVVSYFNKRNFFRSIQYISMRLAKIMGTNEKTTGEGSKHIQRDKDCTWVLLDNALCLLLMGLCRRDLLHKTVIWSYWSD